MKEVRVKGLRHRAFSGYAFSGYAFSGCDYDFLYDVNDSFLFHTQEFTLTDWPEMPDIPVLPPHQSPHSFVAIA